MKKAIKVLLLVAVIALGFSSCQTYNHSMKEPNVYMKLTTDDVELSEQFSAEVTSVKVLFVDWAWLFGKREIGEIPSQPNVASIPVIGSLLGDRVSNIALYKLMKEHPGYDVVIYPQYESHKSAPVLGTGIYSETIVKVTARLGKLKK